MRYPSLTFFNKLKFAGIPSEDLACYAYALNSCKNPASVVSGDWYHKVADVCGAKITELRNEIGRRLDKEGESANLTHTLAVLDETESLVKDIDSQWYHLPLEQLSVAELIKKHSLSKCQHEMRRSKGMEQFTRAYSGV